MELKVNAILLGVLCATCVAQAVRLFIVGTRLRFYKAYFDAKHIGKDDPKEIIRAQFPKGFWWFVMGVK